MSNLIDLTGKTFNRWTVIGLAERPTLQRVASAYWLCKCECGTVRAIDSAKLRGGQSASCGCGRIKHGASGTPTFNSWNAMHQRCRTKGTYAYGLSIAKRWCGPNGFANFLKDMGPRPPGTSIDRIDGKKGYSKSNCRWATRTQQAMNRSNSRNLTLDGKTIAFHRAYEIMHAAFKRGGVTYVIQTVAASP